MVGRLDVQLVVQPEAHRLQPERRTLVTGVVTARDAAADAVELFRKKKTVRPLPTGGLPDPLAPGLTFKPVSGGFLVQSRDDARLAASDLKVMTKRAPTAEEV